MRRAGAASVALAALAAVGCARDSSARSSELTVADRAAIRSLDSSFVASWLKDDTAGVLRVFGRYAVLMPPNSFPIVGTPEIRDYWFPNDGSHTRITAFDRTITEIEGTHQLAFIRGTARLAWLYNKDGKTSGQTSRSSDLIIVALDSTGQWHVIRQMWGALPE